MLAFNFEEHEIVMKIKMATATEMMGPPVSQSRITVSPAEVVRLFPWASMVMKGRKSIPRRKRTPVRPKAKARSRLCGRLV